MNLHTIFSILRRNNKKQYIFYFLSNAFSFAVISAYALLIFSPTVLEVLPVGGDSRKQAFGIFAIVCVGCMMFSFYASSLFFKKKQVELGIIMALGGNKRKLYQVIIKENLLIQVLALLVGILLATPFNRCLWGIMHLFISNEEMNLRMNGTVLGISITFALIIIIVSFILLRNILFSVNILDVIKSEHKNEMVKKPWKHTGLIGVIMTALGGIGGYMAPSIYMNVFSAYPPTLLKLIFIIPLIGVYLILLHAVVNQFNFKKEKYKKMISKSMMIFQGRQTVNCLLVLTLLMGSGCFASFYTPAMMSGSSVAIQTKKWNYQYEIPATITEFNPQKLEDIITSNGGVIKNKKMLPMLLVAGDGNQEMSDGRKFYYVYQEMLHTIYVIKKSDFEDFTGKKLVLQSNDYLAITDSENNGSYDMNLDMHIFTNMTTRNKTNVTCAGTVPCDDLLLNSHTIYVVDDPLYESLKQGLEAHWKNDLYFMQVDHDTNEIAESVYQSFIEYFPMQYRINTSYDYVTKIANNESGQTYWFDEPEYEDQLYLKNNDAKFERFWKYYPRFTSMSFHKTLQNYSVFFMLFVYVTIVAFLASWLIAYTRCMTIGMNNKYVFDNLEKLGASTSFRRKELKKQLKTVYKYPTLIGMIIVILFFALILYGNDGGSYTHSELLALGICVIMELVIGFITAIIYNLTERAVEKTIGLRA